MRLSRIVPLLAALPLTCAGPAHADPCGDLADKVASETKAEIGQRIEDLVRFRAGPDTTLSLSCGGGYPSSVGAQFQGETPPEGFYALFGKAGEAVTGVAAASIREAALKAQADARVRRHSEAPAGGVMVTCSSTKSDKGALTMCAAIEQADKT